MSEQVPPQSSEPDPPLSEDDKDTRALTLVAGGILGAFPDQEIIIQHVPGGIEIDILPAEDVSESASPCNNPADLS